jgi:predicted nuclease of predicted toxin-antitoxin system
MVLWLDEMVPRALADFFSERGHEVHLVRDHFAPSTKDPVVAAAVDEQGAVIVTWDKDFRSLALRSRREGLRYPSMGLIHLGCNVAKARTRLEKLIDLIELEYERAQARSDSRLLIHVGDNSLTVLC